jgi:hypothetical protein
VDPSSKQWLFAVFFEGREEREGGGGTGTLRKTFAM